MTHLIHPEILKYWRMYPGFELEVVAGGLDLRVNIAVVSSGKSGAGDHAAQLSLLVAPYPGSDCPRFHAGRSVPA